MADDSAPLSFVWMEGKCCCCGKLGHESPDCSNKAKIPKEEWAIDKSQQHTQSKKDDDKSVIGGMDASTMATKKEESAIGWSGPHFSFAQTVNMKDLILLDSDSTDAAFCNPKFVSNTQDLDESLSISANGGIMKSHQKCDILHQKCDVPHMENVWFNKDLITNIISMQDMDLKEELALLAHMTEKIVTFKQFSNGSHSMDPKDKKSCKLTKKPHQFLNKAEENLRFLSPRQQKRARQAQELCESMGTPAVDNLKAMTCMDLIKNNLVTTDATILATKAHPPDVGGVKGKTARSKPMPVTSDIMGIPDEFLEAQQDRIVSMDGLTVNSLKFLSAISHELCCMTAQRVTDPMASAFKKCMNKLLGVHKKGVLCH
jgi:hypothetical protein